MSRPAIAAPRRWTRLWILAAVQLLLVLDASVLVVALPAIEHELHPAAAASSWVVNAYALCFGGFMLLGGRLADLLGPRRLYAAGLALLLVASTAAGLAPGFGWLVAARAGQGLAAALISPAALTLVLAVFPGGRPRDRALGVWGAMGVCGVGAGYLLGGLLVAWLGWRSTLLVNLPVAAAALLGARALLGRADPVAAGPSVARRGFDVTGAVTATAGLGLLVYALVNADQAGWWSARTVGSLAGAGLLLAGFVLAERRAASPLVPLEVFTRRALGSADLGLVLVAAAMMPTFYVVARYTEQVLGYGPIRTGAAQLPAVAVLAVASAVAPALVGRLGAKTTVVASLLALAGSLLWFWAGSPRSGYAGALLGPSLVFGTAAVGWIGLTICATRLARPGEFGVVGGLMSTTGQVGAALGLSVLLPLALAHGAGLRRQGLAEPAALAGGYRLAFLVAAGLALAAAVEVAVLLPRRGPADLGSAGAGNPAGGSGPAARELAGSGAPVAEGVFDPRLVAAADRVAAGVGQRRGDDHQAGAAQRERDADVGQRGAGQVEELQVDQAQ